MRSCPTYGGRFHCLPSLADPNRHCAGLSRYFFHEIGQLLRDGTHVPDESRIVQRDHPTKSAFVQSATQQSEDTAVVDDTVYQNAWGACRLYVANKQSPLHGRESFEIMTFHFGPNFFLGQT